MFISLKQVCEQDRYDNPKSKRSIHIAPNRAIFPISNFLKIANNSELLCYFSC